MTQTTTVSIRMDRDLKEKFEEFCKKTGMTITTAISIFANRVVAEQKIPFEIKVPDPFYNLSNIEEIKQAEKRVDNGEAEEHDLIEL